MRNHKLRNTNVIFFCIKCKESSVASQGLRIINVFSIKLASGHGFLVQNRAIMRYTLIVAK